MPLFYKVSPLFSTLFFFFQGNDTYSNYVRKPFVNVNETKYMCHGPKIGQGMLNGPRSIVIVGDDAHCQDLIVYKTFGMIVYTF